MKSSLIDVPVRARRRSLSALVAGVALMSVATVGASAMGTLVAGDTAGTAWSGLPNGASVLGTALGTTLLSVLMARRGPRIGLLTGYGIAAAGAATSAAGAGTRSLPILIVGMVLLGVGNGAAQLGRYTAGDLYPPERRGYALGIVVWGGTGGALVGPGLLAASSDFAGQLRLDPVTGPYLLALGATVIALLAAAALVTRSRVGIAPSRDRDPVALSVLLRQPVVAVALAGMLAGQVSMVAVMTMAPLEMHLSGHGLTAVGAILTVHLMGMFALSPVSGRIAARFGGVRTIVSGLVTLVVAALCVYLAPSVDTVPAFIGLGLLGYGWNLTFVGGSALLSSGLPEASRTRLQGAVDGLSWASSALASVAAGVLMVTGGYPVLAAVAGIAVVITAVLIMIAASRGALSRTASAGDRPHRSRPSRTPR